MMKKMLVSLILLSFSPFVFALPKGFVYLDDIDPTILQDIRYYTSNNFVGRPIKGYEAPRCILTYQAATALSKLQQKLRSQSLGLKVYDCYRPQMAVDDFITWSQQLSNQKMKADYYPHINKADVFKLDYVAKKSSHSKGSTVDLTLVVFNGNQVKEIPMGTHFDFLDPASHPSSHAVSEAAFHNRSSLQKLMIQTGFSPIETEWWHFTLKHEPFPNQFFNFPVQ